MTSDPTNGSNDRKRSVFSTVSRFDRTVLAGIGGMVCAGVLAVAVFPQPSGTSAPRAAFDIESVLRLEPVPTVSVSVAPLKAPTAANGLTVDEVSQTLQYELESVGLGNASVPRVFLASMPSDINDVPEVKEKKAVFFKSVLPLVLQVNEEILRDRRRIQDIADRRASGQKVRAEDRLWLAMMSDRYKTKRGDTRALLARVDVIPPSLALAQAAKESGWGASRFAQQGNALFGQWTWSEGQGIEPKEREAGKDHLVRQFDSLIDSVRAYMRNLNTHRAYRELRSLRAGMRKRGEPLDGARLAAGLKSYSELGMEYVERIRSMISYNQLSKLDDARLATSPTS